MHEKHQGSAVNSVPSSRVLEVALKNCYCGSEYTDLEKDLKERPGILAVDLDRTRSLIRLEYDPNTVDGDSIQAELEHGGYRCECRDRPADHELSLIHI